MSMIETKFHFFQVQQELVPRDARVPLQFGLGIAPEVLNPVDVPTAAGGEAVAMVNAVVPIALRDQPVVAGELVRVNSGALRDLLMDDRPERLPRDVGHGPGVDLAAPLQEPEDRHCAGGPAASTALTLSPEIGFVCFNSPRRGDRRSHSRARC